MRLRAACRRLTLPRMAAWAVFSGKILSPWSPDLLRGWSGPRTSLQPLETAPKRPSARSFFSQNSHASGKWAGSVHGSESVSRSLQIRGPPLGAAHCSRVPC